ncbi:helix-turn-helix transcriptional regulator [Enterococcus sp. LJL128]
MTKKISLEAARKLMGYSQKEAAEKFGVHYQTLAKWETNPSIMKFEHIQMIPSIYLVSTESIFFGNKNEFSSYYAKENIELTS